MCDRGVFNDEAGDRQLALPYLGTFEPYVAIPATLS